MLELTYDWIKIGLVGDGWKSSFSGVLLFYLWISKIFRESLVGTKEQRLKFNNFGFRRAFLIILFVAFRKFFVGPGKKGEFFNNELIC